MSNGKLFQTETAECLKPRDAVTVQVTDESFYQKIASCTQDDRNAWSLRNNEVE